MEAALFDLTFVLAAPFWALMILLPHWRWTKRIMASPLVVVPIISVYAVLVLPDLGAFWTAYSSPTLAGVQSLMGTDAGAAGIWAHLNAFDVFVGRWAYLDSRELSVSAWVMAPVFVLTIFFSPLGLLAYLLVRTAQGFRRRRRAAGPGGTRNGVQAA